MTKTKIVKATAIYPMAGLLGIEGEQELFLVPPYLLNRVVLNGTYRVTITHSIVVHRLTISKMKRIDSGFNIGNLVFNFFKNVIYSLSIRISH